MSVIESIWRASDHDGSQQLRQNEEERALIMWAIAQRQRDEIVRRAHFFGVSKRRIHLLTGIARTTIDRILEEEYAPF